MNFNNQILSIFLLIFIVSKINCGEHIIIPARTISRTRASRVNNNLLYETNNELSDTKYSDLRQSNPIYYQMEISSTVKTPAAFLTTTVKPSLAINYNKATELNGIYISEPNAQTTYLPNHITNKEIANLLKHVQPSIEYTLHQPQNIAVQNAVENELTTTVSDTQFMKGLKTVQSSVLKIAQSIKDFCVYVWRFFSTDSEYPVVEGRKKIKKFHIKKKYKKFLLPLLLAYKLKFFLLVPLLIAGLILLTGSTGMAGFFFALFTAILTLKHKT